MDFKVELSQNSIQELRDIIQEAVRNEIKNLFQEFFNKSNDEQVFLDRKQTCKLLRCSLTTLYHYQKDGRIPFYQVGRKIYFDKVELINHLKVKSKF